MNLGDQRFGETVKTERQRRMARAGKSYSLPLERTEFFAEARRRLMADAVDVIPPAVTPRLSGKTVQDMDSFF
jgi:hypothetical protein